MLLTHFKVLSFGCYGTLIDRDLGILTALRPLLERGRIGLSREPALEAFDRQESALQASQPDLPYFELLAQAHRALAREWAVLCSDAEHTVFARSALKWPPFADAPAALQYFRRYFKIAALTNGDRDSFAGSVRLLEAKFDLVCTAEEVGSYMPDPRNIHYLVHKLARLGYVAGQILHIGASPRRDLAPAAAAGIATAWIDRRPGGGDAKVASSEGGPFDPRFSSIADLVKAHQEEVRA
jgi:2-haloacid dehalogenase